MTETKYRRNQTLECCRMAAALLVVFLHVPFPGTFGRAVSCLGRFAVPMFFAISGWFSYRTPSEKLLRRLGRMLLLELVGIGVTVLWGCALGLYLGLPQTWFRAMLPDGDGLVRWVLWNADPFAGHLWYLSAMACCYGVLWVYTLFFRNRELDYRPLYIAGACFLAAHFAMAQFSRYTGIRVETVVYRNGWFFGIPMFSAGLFLRQYQDRLLKLSGWTLAGILICGFVVSVYEQWCLGSYELPLGAPAVVAVLLLLASVYPEVPGSFRWLGKHSEYFGTLSTVVYILHLVVNDVYQNFGIYWLQSRLGEAESWLRPVLVAAMSLSAGAVWLLVKKVARKLRK